MFIRALFQSIALDRGGSNREQAGWPMAALAGRDFGHYESGKKKVTLFPTHSRKKRGNGWGTRTVFSCRITSYPKKPIPDASSKSEF